jgi:hypothetical protein
LGERLSREKKRSTYKQKGYEDEGRHVEREEWLHPSHKPLDVRDRIAAGNLRRGEGQRDVHKTRAKKKH